MILDLSDSDVIKKYTIIMKIKIMYMSFRAKK